MSLFSFAFLAFLVVVTAVYFVVPKKCQWVCLLIASYVFYMWADVRIVVFLVFATGSTYLVGRWLQTKNDQHAAIIDRAAASGEKIDKKALKAHFTRAKRWILTLGVILPFAVLAVVKYANFTIENINLLLGAAGAEVSLGYLQIVLPLGISFYTFQSVGYLIDVYRGKVVADTNVFKYALFVSYFPQIIQGPIGRHRDLAHQLFEPHSFDYTRVKFGVQRIFWGFFKKMVIADRVAVIVNEVFNNFRGNGYEGVIVFLGAFFYSIQIYADFSGGMDIVCGVSQVFGIELTENFKRPFLAKSVAEFWQRWHITLGSWMRDYLFYPMALSKPFNKMSKSLRKLGSNYAAKVIPTCLASFIVFVLIGVWHGANWKFVVYGLYSAIFVSTATLLEPLYNTCRRWLHIHPDKRWFRAFQVLRTVLLVTVGRYLSRADSLTDAVDMFVATVTEWNPRALIDGTLLQLGLDAKNFLLMLAFIVVLFTVDALQEKGCHIREALARRHIAIRFAVYFIVLFSIILFGMYGPGYNASDFIYQGF